MDVDQLKSRGKTIWHLFREAQEKWVRDKASRLGAAMAFYSLFSVGPLLLLMISIAGLIFGEQDARAELLQRLRTVIGPDSLRTIEAILDSVANQTHNSVAAVVSTVTLVISGSVVIVQLKDALNDIWQVSTKKKGWLVKVKSYVGSAFTIFLLGLGIMVSLLLGTAINVLSKYFIAYLPAPSLALQMTNTLAALMLEILLFAMMFKWLPDTHIRWREVWVGAVVTAILFEIGKVGISIYVGRKAFDSTYGAAGSLVGIMFWIYYSAQIFFFGAEFTQVHARRQRDSNETS